MITALIAAGTTIIVLLFSLLILRAAYNREKQAALRLFQLYFRSNNPETPSVFERELETTAALFGSKIAASLKATFMQAESVNARQNNKLEKAFKQDALDTTNPILGMLAKQFPTVGKMMDNPVMAQKAMSMLGGPGGQRPGGNNEEEIVDLNKFV